MLVCSTSVTTTGITLNLVKEKRTKVHMKMLDGSLLFEEHSIKWIKTPKNVQSRERSNINLV